MTSSVSYIYADTKSCQEISRLFKGYLFITCILYTKSEIAVEATEIS